MAIIPRYSSRALPPGAQSGLIESAQARGRAGAGLGLAAGDAIIAGAKYARRKGDGEADGPAKDRGNPKARRSVKSGARSVDALKNRIAMGRETVARQAGLGDLADAAGLDAELAVARAGGVAAGRGDGKAAGLAARRLAEFDGQAEKSLALFKDRPALKQRADDIVASHARPYEARLLKMETALRPVEEAARLDRALGLFAEAARLDPAGVDGYIGRGLKALEEAGALVGLPPEEIAEKQDRFAGTAATAAVRGLIERDPEGALARLEAGAFDARFDKADLEGLRGEAKTAARAKGARESAAGRARRRGLALDMEDHLAALAETGRGDETLEARARADLPDIEYAAFQADQAAARERYATRAEYAFMTPQEIEADIAAKASGDGPSDGDERDRTHAIRKAVRDEVLAARAADPAGWATRDEDVAAAFAAAEENPDDPAVARKATELRLVLQREMGIDRPRLLSDAERDAVAEELAVLPPTERLARIGDLKGRYSDRFAALAHELAGAVSPDTEILMARSDDPPLAGVLARGMERDGVEFKGARHLWLPLIDGRLDKSRLEDKQLYNFMVGDRIVRVIYDRKADALVPVARSPQMEPAAASAQPNLPDPTRPEDTAGEVAAKFVENIPAMFKRSVGGLIQAVGEVKPSVDPAFVPGGTVGMIFSGAQEDPQMAELRELIKEAETAPNGLGKFGREMFARATLDLQQNAPNVDPESFKGYAYDISSALVQMAPAVGASVVTGNPAVGIAVIGAQVYGDRYGESRAAGRTEAEAHADATFYALTEAIPERIPLGLLMKQGARFLPRLTQSMAAEGVQEMFTELLQAGYDAGILDEDMTWGEAWERIKRAGIVGSFVGGGTAAGAHPFVSAGPTPEDSNAEFASKETGNTHSGSEASANRESDGEEGAGVGLDLSGAESVIDDDQIAGYVESSLHENFSESDRSYAEPGQAGRDAFGLIDPESDKPIIQPINNVERMLAMAKENVEPLTQQLKEITADLPGVEFSGARVKGRERLDEKLANGRRPDTLGDYLGGRIIIDVPAMLDEAMRVLTARYQSVEVDYFIKEPRETGYRAIHVQVVLDNGMTTEIQIIPRDILPVYEKDHENYEKWRNKIDLTSDEAREKEADHLWARNAYNQAYTQWLQRTNRPRP